MFWCRLLAPALLWCECCAVLCCVVLCCAGAVVLRCPAGLGAGVHFRVRQPGCSVPAADPAVVVVRRGPLLPFRDPGSNTLQAVLLVNLASLALSGCPAGDAMERSATSTVGTASDAFGRGMQTVFGIVVPVAAVAWAYLGARVPTWLRAARSLSYVKLNSGNVGKGSFFGNQT